MVLWTALTWILTHLFIFMYGYNGVAFASFLISLTVVITLYMARKIGKFNLLKSISKPLKMKLLLTNLLIFQCKLS